MDEPRADIATQIIDLTDVDLDALDEVNHPILKLSILRILDEADRPEEALSGFSSSI